MGRTTILLLAASMLGGCVSNRLPDPQTTVPATFEAPQSDRAAAASLDRWWTLFDDPQLDGLIEQGLASAPDARTALARLREAQAIRRGALTSYDPQGNPTASISHSSSNGGPIAATASGDTSGISAGFNVSWEVDLFGRRSAARTSADAELAAAGYEFEATRLSLAGNIATQLFTARGLVAQADEAAQTLRIARELADVGRLRVRTGLGSQSDAARLETELANSEADLVRLQAQVSNARRTLLVLLGRGTEPLSTLAVTAELPLPPRPPALTPAELMIRRPDVREAEQRLQSAAGQLRLDQLALFPRFTLQPGASVTRVISPIGYASTAWSVAAGVFAPVLDRPRLLSQIGAQTARGEQAVIGYERAVQAAYGDAETSLTTLSADFVRLDHLTLAEQQASRAFAAQQRGYKAGIITIDTLLQTEQAWRAARLALVALRTTTLVDAVTGFKALGGGWTPDLPTGS